MTLTPRCTSFQVRCNWRPRQLLGAAVSTAVILGSFGCALKADRVRPAPQKAFAATEGSVLYIPASAHVSGASGTNWRTDLELLNPGTERSTVTVSLLRAGQANLSPTQRTINIAAGQTARYTDVLSSLFGFSGAAALRIVNSDGMVAVTSRTYNLTTGGTYGQFVGGVLNPTAIHAGQEGRIVQLTHNRGSNTGFRTNIGFVNVEDTATTVEVRLYTSGGSFLGSRSYTLSAYEFRQIDKIFQQVTGGDVDEGYAVLSTPTAGGAFFAYATVIDNRTGDPIYVTPVIRAASGSSPPPTATPQPTGQPTPTPSPTPTATPPAASANLAPYAPSEWSGPLVASGSQGTNTSGGLVGGSTTYFDWAMANYGDGPATFPDGSVVASIQIEGSTYNFTTSGQFVLENGRYTSYEDAAVQGISAGQHTATLVGDPGSEVPESNEGDNSASYTGTWSGKAAGDQPKTVKVPANELVTRPLPGYGTAIEYRSPVRLEDDSDPASGMRLLLPGKAASYGSNVYIPASAHATGAAGTNWRTDVELHNPGTGQARYEIALLKRDQPNASPQTRIYNVAAGRSLRLTDVLDAAFSFSGAAALRISPLSGDLIATSRTYNLQPDGTYGLFAGAVNEAAAFAAGERAVLMQLTHDTTTSTGFRTNAGMVNCSPNTIELTADFRTSNGSSLGTQTYTLRPYEFIQKDRIYRAVTSGAVSDGYIIFTTQNTGARFLAYATVVDNETGDSVFIPAISVLGQEPVAIDGMTVTQAAFDALGQIGQGDVPSIEAVVSDLQTYGIEQVIASALTSLPAGLATQTQNGVRVDFGNHFVLGEGDIISGSFEATYSNVVINANEVSFDFSGTQENMLWNGGYGEVDGLGGRVDSEVRGGGGVAMDVTMQSFSGSGKTGGVTVSGSAHFDTDICPNYPISGSLTVSQGGEDYTIEFTDACDGTFVTPEEPQTGDVSFRLTWNTPEDLDLYVTEPNGTTIYWGNEGPTSTGGQLDVDSNFPCGSNTNAVENVFWPVGSAPQGSYVFWAERYDSCSSYGGTDTPAFTLQVFEGDEVVRTINGTMPSGGETEHYTHSY
jgi:hypothetical protein